MGWGDCGFDSKGRPIGYIHEATCDEPGCDAKIDRGLAHACGDMHGEFDYYCENYFCSEHLHYTFFNDDDEPEDLEQICNACLNEYLQENNNEKSNQN